MAEFKPGRAIPVLIWIAGLALLSHLSGFDITRVRSLNWDIVLMLTPWGLLQNLVVGLNDYLHPYYWSIPPSLSLAGLEPPFHWHYIFIFLQVVLLELAVLKICFHTPWPRLAKTVVLTHSLTHPVVFFFWMHLPFSYLTDILFAEAFAIVVEALVYRKFLSLPPARAWGGSLLANLVSWQFGPILTALIFLRHRL